MSAPNYLQLYKAKNRLQSVERQLDDLCSSAVSRGDANEAYFYEAIEALSVEREKLKSFVESIDPRKPIPVIVLGSDGAGI